MGSVELKPVTKALVDSLFPPEVFQVDLRQLAEETRVKRSQNSKSSGGRRSGQKPLLAAKDFILPELVSHADNGDLSVSVGSATDTTQLDQVFRLAECGEESLPSFSTLPFAEQQLEKRRYLDYLKRVPKKEAQRLTRQEELATWRAGGSEAEANFYSWWERKQTRKRNALLRKANRVANCGSSGRRMDCSGHRDHMFFGEFKCQVQETEPFVGLTAIKEERLPITKSEALMNE